MKLLPDAKGVDVFLTLVRGAVDDLGNGAALLLRRFPIGAPTDREEPLPTGANRSPLHDIVHSEPLRVCSRPVSVSVAGTPRKAGECPCLLCFTATGGGLRRKSIFGQERMRLALGRHGITVKERIKRPSQAVIDGGHGGKAERIARGRT